MSIDEFESYDPGERRTNAERVRDILARNWDKAIEVAKVTEVDANLVHPVLHRLEKQWPVRHWEPYWKIGDLNAVCNAVVFHSPIC